MSSENDSKWQHLLPELLLPIVKCLTSISDFISFRGVCRSWRSAATFDNFDTELPRLPCLMYLVHKGEKGEGIPILKEKEVVEFKGESDEEKGVVEIWDVDTNTRKITNFPPIYCRVRPPLSCFGWILCTSVESAAVSLRHFLLPISIKLPDMEPWPFIKKMVLSGSPMKSDCVVTVIWGADDGLAFCRPGDESWTEIAVGVDPFDIIYHNRKLYAVDFCGTTIYECDIHGSNPNELVQVFAFDDDMGKLFKRLSYLVESREKFLVVSRYYDWNDEIIVKFRVFEIDLKDGSSQEIHDLRDRSLFLGTNSSICVEIPESESMEVKTGRIYFTFPVSMNPNEVVYRLRDRHFENFFRISHGSLHNWVVPSI